ncbi:hypothetical protein P1P70_09180, partial [Streptomyces sp. MB09-02B]|nr:hypothetical protein [Streptomyces sp. MB09-02B]
MPLTGGGGVPDGERLDRAFLARVLEPGDELGGRWLREFGAREVVRRVSGGGRPLPEASEKRWAGLLARAGRADPVGDPSVKNQVVQGQGVLFGRIHTGDAVAVQGVERPAADRLGEL